MEAARAGFTRRALAILIAAIAVAAAFAVAVIVLLRTPAPDGVLPLVAVIAVLLVLFGLGAPSLWNGIGLLRIRRLRPDALVFLARREPTLAPDLPMYLHRKNITA